MGEFNPQTKFQPFTPINKSLILPTSGDRLGNVRAFRNTLEIDTGVGQVVSFLARSAAFDVPFVPRLRRIQEGYNPFNNPEDLEGYESYFKEFERSTSPEETEMIKAGIDRSMDMRTSIADYHGTRFFGNLFDPINLVPMGLALGKGFGTGAKFAMATGVGPFATSELIRHGIDPTSTKFETVMNVAGGTVFMGLMGGVMGKWSPDPNAIRVGAAIERGLDLVIPMSRPVQGTAHMSIGIPMGYGVLGKQFERVLNGFKSAANSVGLTGEVLGKIVRRKDGKGLKAGLDEAGQKQPLKVKADWYPRLYMETNALRSLEAHHANVGDLRLLRHELESPTHIPMRAEQTGLPEAQIRDIIEADIKRAEAENKQAEAFFARDDVQKQIELEKALGDDLSATVKDLDEYELVNSQALEIINGVTPHLRNEIREFQSILKAMEEKLSATDVRIAKLEEKIAKATRKTEETKYGNQLAKEVEARKFDSMNRNIAEGQLSERKHIASTKEARELVRDWNLAPALLNKIMQSTKQFPWWYLLKNDFRKVDPVLGQKLQEFALAMASSPGLNTFGSNVYRSLGPSVEALVHEHTGPYVKAKKIKERAYTKYLGLGEDTTQLQTYWLDNKQRFKAKVERFREGRGQPPKARADGAPEPMTLGEWNVEVSRALMLGRHDIPEIMEAAKPYREIWNNMGKAAKDLQIYQTQKGIDWEMTKVQKELDELNEKFERTGLTKNQLAEKADYELQMMALEKRKEAYEAAGSEELTDAGYFHIMYDPILLRQKREQVVKALVDWFQSKRTTRYGDQIVTHKDMDLQARAEETYSSLLREAEAGEAERGLNTTDKRPWLEARRAEHDEAMKGTPLEGMRQPDEIRLDIERLENNGKSSVAEKNELQSVEEALAIVDKSDIPLPLNKKIGTKFRRNGYIDDKLRAIEQGTPTGMAGPLMARDLDVPNEIWMDLGVINMDIDTVMAHYIFRMAPAIETARKFGDATAAGHIKRIVKRMDEAVEKLRETDPKAADKLAKKAVEYQESMNDLRDIVHGFLQTTSDPANITGRTLRALRNFNVLGSMGRSAYMALGDTGNIIISQGFTRTFGHAFNRMTSGVHSGKLRMIDSEVELAGAATEVALGLRYRSFTETGAQWWAGNAFEKSLGDATQRFFMHNLLGPWTDMASKVAGGMIQSRIVENSIAWSKGTLSVREAKIMSRLNIDRETAKVIAREWKRSGGLKHREMFIANTTEWSQGTEWARSIFRAALNDEVRRAVIIPGAVDKPTALLKSEWWKIFGQYKGFGLSASNRILASGIQQEGMNKVTGMLSMVAIAAIVDGFKRPDYIQMSIDEQLLRAVELSGVTGVLLDVNDIIERISAGNVGIRPAFGMDIRERNPNWANRVGALAGAVPNQWLTLFYGLTSDEASTNDAARGIRYMIPYNNLWAFNSSVNRIQRAAVDMIED